MAAQVGALRGAKGQARFQPRPTSSRSPRFRSRFEVFQGLASGKISLLPSGSSGHSCRHFHRRQACNVKKAIFFRWFYMTTDNLRFTLNMI